jgi:hypothetical protein
MPETAPAMGFRAQMREALSREPISLVPVTEHNLPRFDAVLTNLNTMAMSSDGMVSFTGNPTEPNQEWFANVKNLWLYGAKDGDYSKPENVEGFVNVYAPEHMDKVNKWLQENNQRPYDDGAVVEYASFGLHSATNPDLEMSATKQALSKVFVFDVEKKYQDVRAVTVWASHDVDNTLNATEAEQIAKLGGRPLGVARYAEHEAVDSTCFIIPRKAFTETIVSTKTPVTVA